MPRLQVFLKIFTVAKDIVPGCYSGEYSNKDAVIAIHMRKKFIAYLYATLAGFNKPCGFGDMCPCAIRLNCPIEVIIVPPRRAEVILCLLYTSDAADD